jgi:hypothetical protein
MPPLWNAGAHVRGGPRGLCRSRRVLRLYGVAGSDRVYLLSMVTPGQESVRNGAAGSPALL